MCTNITDLLMKKTINVKVKMLKMSIHLGENLRPLDLLLLLLLLLLFILFKVR
ncbi:hypothetical protein Hdeb2414_s1108g00982881 [Helianthus debilis subsp. tardiflorus]